VTHCICKINALTLIVWPDDALSVVDTLFSSDFMIPIGGDYIVTGVRIQKKYAVECKPAIVCAVVQSRALVTPTGISRVIKQK